MPALTRLELKSDGFAFASGHFTIFSATERERVHGHSYSAIVRVDCEVDAKGLAFDYHEIERPLLTICAELDRHFILAENSPFLNYSEEGDYLYAHFNNEKIPFLKDDVKLLPITNASLEELSRWLCNTLVDAISPLSSRKITRLELEVSNGQICSGASWHNATDDD